MVTGSAELSAKSPIGVIDSGVGGLTTVAQLSKLLPGENIIYAVTTATLVEHGISGSVSDKFTPADLHLLTLEMEKQFLAAAQAKAQAAAQPSA